MVRQHRYKFCLGGFQVTSSPTPNPTHSRTLTQVPTHTSRVNSGLANSRQWQSVNLHAAELKCLDTQACHITSLRRSCVWNTVDSTTGVDSWGGFLGSQRFAVGIVVSAVSHHCQVTCDVRHSLPVLPAHRVTRAEKGNASMLTWRGERLIRQSVTMAAYQAMRVCVCVCLCLLRLCGKTWY